MITARDGLFPQHLSGKNLGKTLVSIDASSKLYYKQVLLLHFKTLLCFFMLNKIILMYKAARLYLRQETAKISKTILGNHGRASGLN